MSPVTSPTSWPDLATRAGPPSFAAFITSPSGRGCSRAEPTGLYCESRLACSRTDARSACGPAGTSGRAGSTGGFSPAEHLQYATPSALLPSTLARRTSPSRSRPRRPWLLDRGRRGQYQTVVEQYAAAPRPCPRRSSRAPGRHSAPTRLEYVGRVERQAVLADEPPGAGTSRATTISEDHETDQEPAEQPRTARPAAGVRRRRAATGSSVGRTGGRPAGAVAAAPACRRAPPTRPPRHPARTAADDPASSGVTADRVKQKARTVHLDVIRAPAYCEVLGSAGGRCPRRSRRRAT